VVNLRGVQAQLENGGMAEVPPSEIKSSHQDDGMSREAGAGRLKSRSLIPIKSS